MNNNYIVYMHINKINNKKYIGITSKEANVRWGKNGNGYRKSTYFHNAIHKYGWDNFDHIIIKSGLKEQDAKSMEVDLIKKYNTTDNLFGYNLTFGGQGNIPNDIVREKMSKSQKEVWRNNKYKEKMRLIRREIGQAKEFKEKISLIIKSSWKVEKTKEKRIHSLKKNGSTKEFKEKMSKLNLGENNGFYGKKHKEETKEKMRLKKIGKSLTCEHKQKVSQSLKKSVVMLDAQGMFINEFHGISDIKKQLGISTSHISSCCRGKRKTASGFKWMYKEDYDKYINNAM